MPVKFGFFEQCTNKNTLDFDLKISFTNVYRATNKISIAKFEIIQFASIQFPEVVQKFYICSVERIWCIK